MGEEQHTDYHTKSNTWYHVHCDTSQTGAESMPIRHGCQAHHPTDPPIIHYRRWYDDRPPVSKCLHIIQQFPKNYGSLIAHGAITLADKRFKADKLYKSKTGLSNLQLAALYNTHRRRKEIDSLQSMRYMYRYLLILPRDKGDDLCKKTLRLMDLVLRYLHHCNLHIAHADVPTIQELIDIFVGRSEQAAVSILTEMVASHPETPLQDLKTYQALSTLYVNERLVAVPTVMPTLSPA
jgi:hypothetical protein